MLDDRISRAGYRSREQSGFPREIIRERIAAIHDSTGSTPAPRLLAVVGLAERRIGPPTEPA
jgi:hypothetical protein